MKIKNLNAKRILSFLLAIVIIFTTMPMLGLTTAAEGLQSTSIADPKTLSNWEDWFDEGSSRYAGAVYVDKSVYTADEAMSDSYFANIRDSFTFGKDNFGNDNFLIALSALGSNSEVKGYSYTPTDTMIVLDASTSMGTGNINNTAIDNMVAGANDAIKRLLSLNNYNRVGVVVYNGTSTVLLPLDNYSVKVGNEYLTSGSNVNFLTFTGTDTGRNNWDGSDIYDNRINIAPNVVNGQKQAVTAQNGYTSYVAQASGTYTQGGIYSAAQEFLKADPTIEDGKIQGGTNRIPIMVLMTDGEPSYRTKLGTGTTVENYANATNANCDNSNFREDDITCFSTMLTAAWAEGEITARYKNDTRFYTLGYNLTSDHQYAANVLDPMNPNNALGTRFINFANQYLAMDKGEKETFDDTSVRNYNEFAVKRVSDPAKTTSLDYVDKYWTASGASNLTAAFDSIVDEIIIQSRYYSTFVDSDQHHQDGFISLTDEIGSYMDVKNIKGVYLGHDKLVTGGMFAEFAVTGKTAAYTGGAYTDAELRAFSLQILNAIQERFNISADEAANLLEVAKENKFIDWNKNTGEFSNYMAWYANADNEYLAPYTGVNALAANDAKYLVRSYFYMGDVTQNHVETSMLYMLVRVREDLDTGRQIVDVNIPAALLPMVTYSITVDGDTFTEGNITGITCERKTPISLLYEVGLNDDIYSFNIAEKMAGEDFRKELDEHGNFTGNYIFYTNRWRANDGTEFVIPTTVDPHVFNHGIMNTTVSQFIPSIENTRYYYTQNTQIYTKVGNNYEIYTGAKPTTGGYYHRYDWVEGNADNAELKFAYNPITENAIDGGNNVISVLGKSGWFIKAGTPKYYFGAEIFDEPNHQLKTQNVTKTLEWSNDINIVHHHDETHDGYHVLSYLGNNGLVKAAVSQGIKLTKNVETVVEGAPDSFTFNIALSGSQIATSYPVQIVAADGTIGALSDRPVVSGSLSVTLKDGETAYITGIAPETEYTVTESYSPYYTANATNSKGKIVKNELSEVDFVNTPKGYGSLLVSKDVAHPFGDANVPDNLADKEFDVTVTFNGNIDDIKNIVDYEGIKNTVGKTVFNFKLKDGTSALFTNIPEGVKYTVTESNMPSGFSLDATASVGLDGTIVKDVRAHASLINDYAPAAVTPDIVIKGDKTLNNYTSATWNYEFKVALQQVILGGQGTTSVGAPITEINGSPIVMTQSNGYEFNLGDAVTFDKIGTYSYIIYEVDDGIQDITYSTKYGVISIVVTDEDVDGQLEVNTVESYIDTVDNVSGDSQNGWEITKNFINHYDADQISFNVKKTVNGASDHLHDSGIMFGLFENENDTNPVYYSITDKDGIAAFAINVLESAFTPAKTYYLREVKPLVDSSVTGMTYDTAVKYTVTIGWDAANGKATSEFKNYGDGSVVSADKLVINNTLESVETIPLKLSGTKTLNGGNLRQNDTFTFKVYDTDSTFIPNISERETVTATAVNGELVFDDISFDTVGTHYIKIVEVVGDTTKGIVYDPTEYHITVKVSKAYDGTKSVLAISDAIVYKTGVGNITLNKTAAEITSDEIDFNNLYHINDYETVSVGGLKTVTATAPLTRKPLEGEFSFGLYRDGSSTPIYVVTNDANGKFRFPELTYTILNETEYNKEFKYTVKEIVPASGDNKGITTYDNTVYEITVQLYDDGNGKVTKKVFLDTTEVTDVNVSFENKYTATNAELVLSGEKTLTGKTLENGEFTFNLYETNSDFVIADMAAPLATTVNSKTSDSTGDYSFELEYDENGLGTHYYVLIEAVPADTAGVHYDITRYDITVSVYDNGHGELEAHAIRIATQYESGIISEDELDFNNIYKASPTSYTISGIKGYNKQLLADMFEFRLSDENSSELETVKNAADGSFSFSAMEFTSAGTYKYYVDELKGGTTDKGIKYDSAKFTVEIKIADNLDGELYVDGVTYTRVDGGNITNPSSITFTNVYSVTSGKDVDISGTKEIIGRDMTNNDVFEFELYETDLLLNEGTTPIQTVNNSGANFKFTISYTPDDAGQTFYYVIKEKNGGSKSNGITNSTQKFYLTVKVKDNGDGTLVTEANVTNGPVKFTNTYEAAKTSVSFEGTKKLEGIRELKANDFTFEIYNANSSFATSGAAIKSVKNDADGKFKFEGIELNEEKTYYFVIKENSTAPIGGVTYDNGEYHITVVVKDNGSGSLVVDSKPMTDKAGRPVTEITFVNTYSPQAATATIEGTKKLDGRNIADGEFQFLLYSADANYVEKAGQTPLKAVNDADGKFKFSKLDFENVGTYYYIVKEDSTVDLERITFDDTVYQIAITVTDDENGKLESKIDSITIKDSTDTVNSIEFNNVFTPKPDDLKVNINVKKTVKNIGAEAIGPEGFEFVLEESITKDTQVVSSDKDGLASFELSFTEEDIGKVYNYKITEKAGDKANVTYSNDVYNIAVEITLNSDNKLVATISQNEKAEEAFVAEFENVYDYTPEVPQSPQTGDNSNVTLCYVLVLLAGCGLVAVSVCKKRISK